VWGGHFSLPFHLQDGTNGEVKKKALSYTQITFMHVCKEILSFIAFPVLFVSMAENELSS
jgi:hypothetical protein